MRDNTEKSRGPISRILCLVSEAGTIHLGRPSPDASSSLPAGSDGPSRSSRPIWDCSIQRLPVSPHPFGRTRLCCSDRRPLRSAGGLPRGLLCGVRTFLPPFRDGGCLARKTEKVAKYVADYRKPPVEDHIPSFQQTCETASFHLPSPQVWSPCWESNPVHALIWSLCGL